MAHPAENVQRPSAHAARILVHRRGSIGNLSALVLCIAAPECRSSARQGNLPAAAHEIYRSAISNPARAAPRRTALRPGGHRLLQPDRPEPAVDIRGEGDLPGRPRGGRASRSRGARFLAVALGPNEERSCVFGPAVAVHAGFRDERENRARGDCIRRRRTERLQRNRARIPAAERLSSVPPPAVPAFSKRSAFTSSMRQSSFPTQ